MLSDRRQSIKSTKSSFPLSGPSNLFSTALGSFSIPISKLKARSWKQKVVFSRAHSGFVLRPTPRGFWLFSLSTTVVTQP